jgi:hypothetical protein
MTSPADLASRLLDAHVEHIVGQLTGPDFSVHAEGVIEQALSAATSITLGEAVNRDQIKAVARRYAVEMDLVAAIPEIAGDVAARLHSHPLGDTSSIRDIVPRAEFEAWLTKAVELHTLRTRVFQELEQNQLVRDFVASTIYTLITDFLKENRERVGKIPGVGTALGIGGTFAGIGGSMAGKVGGKVGVGSFIPDPGKELDQRIRSFAEQGAHTVLRQAGGAMNQSDLPIIEIGLDLYDEHAGLPLSGLRDLVSLADVEDVIVLGYEFWRGFRETEQFGGLLDSGIDLFFDHYGERTLTELLDEFGVTRADLLAEAMRFAPPILSMLAERGLLRDLVRGQLASFYESPAARAVLAGSD